MVVIADLGVPDLHRQIVGTHEDFLGQPERPPLPGEAGPHRPAPGPGGLGQTFEAFHITSADPAR